MPLFKIFKMKLIIVVFYHILLSVLLINNLYGQCENTTHYPNNLFFAPHIGDTLLISELQFAGDYCEMAAFNKEIEYNILSTNVNDYITVRSSLSNVVLTHGPAPLVFIPLTDTLVTIHFNLADPLCGTDVSTRVTSITNVGAPIDPDTRVGINVTDPQAALDINGKLKLSNDDSAPLPGMLRYNAETQDFEGFDGDKWQSLTKANDKWGQVSHTEVGQSKLLSLSNGSPFDVYGLELAHSNNTLIVSSSREDVDGTHDQGRVYVYEAIGPNYMLADSLDDPNAMQFGLFGNGDLDVNDDYIIVGSGQNISIEGNTNGSATIFKKEDDNWIVDTVFTDSIDGEMEIDGYTVGIYPPYAIVSGELNDVDHIFVYRKIAEEWSQIQAIDNPSDQLATYFGAHAIIDDSRLFISSPDELYDMGHRGLIYVFQNDGIDNYNLVDTIFSNFPGSNYAVTFAVHDEYLIVSDPRKFNGGFDRRGVVDIHHYENGDWIKEQTLQLPDDSQNDLFGSSLDINGEEIVIGCIGIISNPIKDHKAFVYKKNNNVWTHTTTLRPSNPQVDSHFGTKAAIGDNVIFISDYQDDVNGNDRQGSVYMYCR